MDNGAEGLVEEVRDGTLLHPEPASCSWKMCHVCQEATNVHLNEASDILLWLIVPILTPWHGRYLC